MDSAAYDSYSPFLYAILHRKHKLRKAALSQLSLRQSNCVLDVGCGTGLMFDALLKSVGNTGKLTAVDASSSMIQAAQEKVVKKGWKNVVLVEGDAEKLSFTGQPFDAALSFLSLSCVEDHMQIISTVMNALKSGGRFVIVDGKPFSLKVLNIFMPLIRSSASWDASKDLMGDLKEQYGEKIVFEKTYSLGSNFIIVLEKS